LHGRQEGRFFHGYYDSYCYLPLFCFVGDVPVWAQFRTSDTDASAGTCEALEKIVPAIRRRFPKAKIVVRNDSGFSREAIFAWCERQKDVYYLIGMDRNARLETLVAPALMRVQERLCLTGVPCREFLESEYSTLSSWSCARRMLCRAEALAGMKSNPRFVTTNIPAKGISNGKGGLLRSGDAQSPYEEEYCGRGNAENQVKQMVLDLKADRTSSSWLASNQMRLWFSTLAYLLLERVRKIGLKGTEWAKASLGTLRLWVLKVAACVRVSVRRIHVALSPAFPLQGVFRQAARRLGEAALESQRSVRGWEAHGDSTSKNGTDRGRGAPGGTPESEPGKHFKQRRRVLRQTPSFRANWSWDTPLRRKRARRWRISGMVRWCLVGTGFCMPSRLLLPFPQR
jgi:hypothetical protein